MSAGFDFLLFLLLWYLTDRVSFRGAITALYMMIYSVARFFIEMIRIEPATVGPFTTAQFCAILIFTAGLILFFVMRKKALPPLRKVTAEGETAEEAEPEEETPEEESAACGSPESESTDSESSEEVHDV